MEQETKNVRYDEELDLEAFHFTGVTRPFANHFHEYYVVGLIEGGQRRMTCNNRESTVGPQDVLIFHPGESHACVREGEAPLNYRSFHISQPRMLDLAQEITGKRELPGFCCNALRDEEVECSLRALHQMVMEGSREFEKEEMLLLTLARMIEKYGRPFEQCVPELRHEVEAACDFIRRNYDRHVALEDICRSAGLSKSTLLRCFTKSMGVTPYRYLESIRITQAKKLLEAGATPLEAAMRTGFSDQSHFTNFFTMFIGLSPGAYRGIFRKKEEEARHDET